MAILGTAECIGILCRSLTYTNPASASRPTPTEEFNDTHVHSPLLRHEVAFVLGQLRNAQACATLEEVLRDVNDDVMVRHECAEALGAIGDVRSIPLLEALASDATGNDLEEIQQTCEVARDFLNWKAVGGESSGEARPGVVCACMISEYNSHDPAPVSSLARLFLHLRLLLLHCAFLWREVRFFFFVTAFPANIPIGGVDGIHHIFKNQRPILLQIRFQSKKLVLFCEMTYALCLNGMAQCLLCVIVGVMEQQINLD